MKYPGSKGGFGVGQWLINNIPVHDRYFELFVGSGKLLEMKRPALENFINDLNPVIIEYHRAQARANTFITNKSALDILKFNIWRPGDFIYLDPPYPRDARQSRRDLYDFEMMDSDGHEQLLSAARDLAVPVMISTRQNDLYDTMLHDWRKKSFQTGDRGGL